jgi:hypothetical protein
MRLMFVSILSLLAIAPLSAQPTESLNQIETYQFQACDYWSRGNSGDGYVCQFYPSRVEVPTARDTARVIRDLLQKIRDLEARVAVLEAGDR